MNNIFFLINTKQLNQLNLDLFFYHMNQVDKGQNLWIDIFSKKKFLMKLINIMMIKE